VAEADFEHFFRREHDTLVAYCWGLTVDRDAAADLAQEAMARAWSAWSTIGVDDSNPVAWLRVVVLNLVRSGWRRSRVAAERAPMRAPDPVEPGTRDLDLEQALRELPVRQREAVVLHHLLDLAVAECAVVMGVGESTVKVHLRRGRAALASALAPEDEAPVVAGRVV
jgi:RNA polymerase sigma-70 factor (sigma-E family)